ELWPRPQIPP
nr:peptide POL236 [Crotalus atrox]